MEKRSQTPDRRISNQYDPVTNLPTRQKLLDDAHNFSADHAKLIMITLADARHYNEILRALGHDYADEFVRTALARIRMVVPPDIEMYHVSVLSIAFVCDQHSEFFVGELIKAFESPIRCAGIPILSRVGIGLVDFNQHSVIVSLRTALAAAQDSRNTDAGWAGYNKSTDDAHRRSFQLLSDLPAALQAKDQLSLVYQPKINFVTGKCCGVEALLRWVHPWLGPISPAEFIPMVESTALIGPMTEWVFREAVRQLSGWSAQGLRLNIAVNISPQNLMQIGFHALVMTILDEQKIDPRLVELEFTEGMLVTNDARVVRSLRSLRDNGVRIALDDFGTGFSNLSYLTSLPADMLKLDQSFIRKISTDESTALLVRTFTTLAQKLGYVVVAEGIEDAATYELLRSWHCDEGQGYFMSRPVNPARLTGWLAESQPSSRA